MNVVAEPLLFKQVIAGRQRELVRFATHPSNYQIVALTPIRLNTNM